MSTLVCFAVKEEAAPFRSFAAVHSGIRVLIHGMGARNAEQSFREALARETPQRVFTCGFAGGLHPLLAGGDVVFSATDEAALRAAGAKPVRFHCAARVAVTAAEKAELRKKTGADAVEMESAVIAAICFEKKIPCVTLRVISDPAHEDLPLDFNRLMTAEQNLHFGRLVMSLVKSPGKIRELLKLRRGTRLAAENLARVLARVTAG